VQANYPSKSTLNFTHDPSETYATRMQTVAGMQTVAP